ncbi:MAG: sigma factor-like helix-turn-helix DNA-binding protein [Parcubacteria group bacterium]
MENINSKINFQDLLVNLLSKLSVREQDVLKQRYQLISELEDKATLREIGEAYNITRERVRQIEAEAIRKLSELATEKQFANDLKSLEAELVAHLERSGGLVREDILLSDFAKKNYGLDFLHENAYLFVLEHLFDSAERVGDLDSFYAVWKLNDFDIAHVARLVENLEKHFSEHKNLQSDEEIVGLAKEKLHDELKAELEKILAKHSDLRLEDIIESYLNSTSKLEKNIMNQWGMSEWENVRPKKLGDKINLTFLQHKEPLHFRDIAAKINSYKFDAKNICPATVHNELIANDKFVLIGRGVYALKDWGYSEGTVADIISRILQEAGQPLAKQEIFDQVLKQRKVNPSTIYLSLINRDKFEKLGGNKYGLKK